MFTLKTGRDSYSMVKSYKFSGVSLFVGVLMSCSEEGAGGAPERSHTREFFLKQGLLAHSEQILKCGGGHWICPLCAVL